MQSTLAHIPRAWTMAAVSTLAAAGLWLASVAAIGGPRQSPVANGPHPVAPIHQLLVAGGGGMHPAAKLVAGGGSIHPAAKLVAPVHGDGTLVAPVHVGSMLVAPIHFGMLVAPIHSTGMLVAPVHIAARSGRCMIPTATTTTR
jgi:hypothetical protein